MAEITVSNNPAKVVAADTNDNYLNLRSVPGYKVEVDHPVVVKLKVTTGQFQFNVDGVVSASNPTYTTTAGQNEVWLSLYQNNVIYFKAGTLSDVFELSI